MFENQFHAMKVQSKEVHSGVSSTFLFGSHHVIVPPKLFTILCVLCKTYKTNKQTLAILTMFGSRIAYLHEQFFKNPSKLIKKNLARTNP
jgi:hypothetical protein